MKTQSDHGHGNIHPKAEECMSLLQCIDEAEDTRKRSLLISFPTKGAIRSTDSTIFPRKSLITATGTKLIFTKQSSRFDLDIDFV